MLIFTPLLASADKDLETLQQKARYSFGVDFAKRLKQQGIDLDISALNRGIKDQASGSKLAFEEGEMNQFKAEYTQQLRDKLMQEQQKIATQNLEAGKKFLADNAKKEGVKTTASGLQYKIVKPGTGKAPKQTDEVTVNYRGTLINGNEFDSSDKHGEPATFKLDGVIKGWTEGLQLIKEGGKIQLFIPPELAYGDRGPLGHRTLIFDVELVSVGADKQAGSVQETQTQNK